MSEHIIANTCKKTFYEYNRHNDRHKYVHIYSYKFATSVIRKRQQYRIYASKSINLSYPAMLSVIWLYINNFTILRLQ